MTNTWFSVSGIDDEAEALAQARLVAAWPDAPLTNLEVCALLLEVAEEQVTAYAPALVPDDEGVTPPLPGRYVYAQLQQAVNLWNAGRVSTSGEVGMDSYSFTPRPLDKTIQQILRPRQGVPNVG
jgi:hypothetical protein